MSEYLGTARHLGRCARCPHSGKYQDSNARHCYKYDAPCKPVARNCPEEH